MSLLPGGGCSLCLELEPRDLDDLLAGGVELCPVCARELVADERDEERPRAVVRASSDWPAPERARPRDPEPRGDA